MQVIVIEKKLKCSKNFPEKICIYVKKFTESKTAKKSLILKKASEASFVYLVVFVTKWRAHKKAT